MILGRKMMRIYYHIDELGRDAVVASALKKYFLPKGIKLIYGNRVTTPMLKYSTPFDLLIFPSVDLAYLMLGKNTDFQAPVVILPTESISGTESTLQRLKMHLMGIDINKWESAVNDVTLFFLWGESHLNALTKEFPLHKEKFVLIGHPRHDLKCRKSKKPKLSRAEDSKIKVGLITRFDLINVFDDRSNLTIVASGRTTGNEYWNDEFKNIEDRFFTSVQDLRIFFELIDLIGHTHSISLRVYPRENYDNWKELITSLKLPVELCPRYDPFLHWVEDQDFLIAPPSTSFYDCAVAEKSVISIGNLISSRNDHALTNSDDFDPIFQYFPMPKSFKELLELISKSPLKPNISRGLAGQLAFETGYPFSEKSLETMCDVICKKFPLKARMEPIKIVEIIFFNFLIGLKSIKFLCIKMIRRNYEQSSVFLLTRRVIKYIDSLAN